MMIGWRIIETDNKVLPVNKRGEGLCKIMMMTLQPSIISGCTGGLWEMIRHAS